MKTSELAKKIRKHVVEMTYRSKSSHIGSCFSVSDIIAVLYGKLLNIDPKNPENKDRDHFILSKGHAAATVYAVLAERGFIPKEWLIRYGEDDSFLSGHITHKFVAGVEVSTGSLGHGLSIACGLAYAKKQEKSDNYAYVIMSDGELNEGSNWEGLLFAGHHKLSTLIVFIDYNKIQAFGKTNEILNLEPLVDKLKAFRWHVQEINGHNHQEVENAVVQAKKTSQPSIIIAHTIKGKGVSFMEDQLTWHYRSPNDKDMISALKELDS